MLIIIIIIISHNNTIVDCYCNSVIKIDIEYCTFNYLNIISQSNNVVEIFIECFETF